MTRNHFKRLWAMALCAAVAAGAATQASATLRLSLDECLRIALSENPTVKVADMEINRVD